MPANSYSIKVTLQLLDSKTDGKCAKVKVTSLATVSWGTECNGVWKSYSWSLSDPFTGSQLHVVDIVLGTGSSGSKSFSPESGITWQAIAPAGW